jgi:hypothetical protein
MQISREPNFALVYSAIVFPLVALDIALMMMGYTAAAYSIILIALVPFMVAETVKMRAETAERTERRLIVSSPLAPEAAFHKLAAASFGSHLKVVDTDPARRVLVLSSPMRGWSMGFYYPVFVKPSGTGSEIEVGLVRRAVQHPRIVGNHHAICAAEIDKALKA